MTENKWDDEEFVAHNGGQSKEDNVNTRVHACVRARACVCHAQQE